MLYRQVGDPTTQGSSTHEQRLAAGPGWTIAINDCKINIFLIFTEQRNTNTVDGCGIVKCDASISGLVTGQTELQYTTAVQCTVYTVYSVGLARVSKFIYARKAYRGAPLMRDREYIQYSSDLKRAPFTMTPLRLSHRFSFFLPNALLYYVKRENKGTNYFPMEP